jgi:hypothetical protein
VGQFFPIATTFSQLERLDFQAGTFRIFLRRAMRRLCPPPTIRTSNKENSMAKAMPQLFSHHYRDGFFAAWKKGDHRLKQPTAVILVLNAAVISPTVAIPAKTSRTLSAMSASL